MLATWYKKFSSQPHQPFFTNGIIFFILFMMLFIATFSNVLILDDAILTYHAYTMIFVVFIQFFLGFLFVVFPRFLSQAEILPKVYMQQFLLYFASSVGILLSLIFVPSITFIFQILMLIAQILSFNLLYSIHKKSIVPIKEDTKWILIAFLTGVVMHALFIISTIDFKYSLTVSTFAINCGFYLFLFMIIFTVSQRMIPFFTKTKVPTYVINKSKNLLPIVYGLLILKIFFLSLGNPAFNLLADVPLLVVFVRELIKWNLPTFKVTAIMWVLFISLYWIPFALLISVIESLAYLYDPSIIFEKAVIHTLALGYFVTVLVGFGTRVVLGHSGTTPYAGKFAITIFIAIQIIAFLRIFTSFSLNFDLNYIFLLNLTALLLVAGLIIWSSKYLTILLKGK
ncbi:beta-carotene 15,15'-monooxygenase [Poseidonibacter parvus]|uniref:Beta-carotene 15,15'-monooxygenase n=1 Tax=Poseidonibacter parvus TaxID=1850254 RepID=A0A1P8KK94_9BACT|nr:NnrS family protein [Poseidonibacter parvus]APW64978.1 beta-carotene 15,15'-monooxygenase [Poseidonibacter parvus]